MPPPPLLALPLELHHAIAAHLVGHTPLGPPAALLPLMLTCRTLHAALARDDLLARICRMKLDVRAVARRMFRPANADLADHLVYVCRLLRALRRGLPDRDVFGNDVLGARSHGEDLVDDPGPGHPIDSEERADWDPSHVLFACLVLLLDNDGRNFAQLEWAGVHAYAAAFVRTRLWDGAHANDGWPLENAQNACALWVMWLALDRQQLRNETVGERELIVESIFPYVVLPQRYPASEAPPNHFHLPLASSPSSPSTQIPQQPALAFPIPSFSATAYTTPPPYASHTLSSHPSPPPPQPTPKSYPHYLPPRPLSTPYFRSRPPLTPPPASIAAKLLYVARRELRVIEAPAHLPLDRESAGEGWRGPTQADYGALNGARGARVGRGARWDWERGRSGAVNPDESNGGDRDRDGAEEDEDNDEEESKKWDTTWWRMRLCGDYRVGAPRFAPGMVFEPGCMRGVWKGKIYIPSGVPFSHILHTEPRYPGVPDERGRFSEASIGLIMQPVFLEVGEHHRVCVGGGYGVRSKTRASMMEMGEKKMEEKEKAEKAEMEGGKEEGGEEEEEDGNGHGDGPCGTVPVPPPAPRAWAEFEYARPYLRAGAEARVEEQNRTQQSEAAVVEGSRRLSRGARRQRRPQQAQPPQQAPQQQPQQPSQQQQQQQPHPHPHHPPPPANPLALHNIPLATPLPLHPRSLINDPASTTAPDGPDTHPSHPANRAVAMPAGFVLGAGEGEGERLNEGRRIGEGGGRGIGEGTKVDRGMANAWFPGTLGGVRWGVREGAWVEDGEEEGRKEAGRMRMRDELVVSVDREPDVGAEGRCARLPARAPGSSHSHGTNQSQSQSESETDTWVYETYDPARVGAHDRAVALHGIDACRRCKERAERVREIRRAAEVEAGAVRGMEGESGESEGRRRRRAVKEERVEKAREEGIRMLDEAMRKFGRAAHPGEEEGEGEREEMEDLDMGGVCLDLGRARGGDNAEEEDESDEDEEEDEDEEMDSDDDDERLSILGDDLPHGEPGLWVDAHGQPVAADSDSDDALSEPESAYDSDSTFDEGHSTTTPTTPPRGRATHRHPLHHQHKTYIPSTRREFSPSQLIGPSTPSHPCPSAAADILLTGRTPPEYLMWGQPYTLYGRVRPWDGLVGMLRVPARSVVVSDFLFMFGYVVGGGTFVGEWRMASSDMMRPTWGSAVVLSRAEE